MNQTQSPSTRPSPGCAGRSARPARNWDDSLSTDS